MKKTPITVALLIVVCVILAIPFFTASAEAEDLSKPLPAPKPADKIVLLIGSSKAVVDEEEILVDEEDPSVVPFIEDGKTYVPVTFLEERLAIELDTAETDIIEDFGNEYAPLRSIAESAGKQVFYADGLIVISKDVKTLSQTETAALKEQLFGLSAVGSKEKLESLLGQNDIMYYAYDDVMVEEEAAVEYDSVAGAAPEASNQRAAASSKESADLSGGDSDYSATNVQVQGVDEGDIIKTDGAYIYYAWENQIAVVKAEPADSMTLVSKLSYGDDGYINELYVDNDTMIVMLTSYEQMSAARKVSYGYYNSKTVTQALVYDMADKGKPKLVKTVELDGYYVSSRKIGDDFYFVTNLSAWRMSAEEDYPLPTYKDSAVSETSIDIGYDRIYYYPEVHASSYTNIAGFRLGDQINRPVQVETFLGGSENMYVSRENMYMTTTTYKSTASGRPTGYYSTNIYKFMLDGGKVTYTTRGRVDGSIINQFSMDEHNGYFRIATTDYVSAGGSVNHMYVLDKDLKQTGHIGNIAPDEQIYSVRFMGNKAYMVTFKTVDPLFALDLSDPENPKILGELKIPGYSNYLHPYDENHLIGFGMDTIEEKGVAYNKGMKVALFDITDMANPKEKYAVYIGDRGTSSDILYNHKALLFSKDKNLLAFPVEIHTIKNNSKSSVFEYGEFSFQGAYVYSLDLSEGFTFKGGITHLDEDMDSRYDYNAYVQRILYIGDNLYTVSNNTVMATDMNSMKEAGRTAITAK